MAIRPNGFSTAPTSPKAKRVSKTSSTEGGTPRGWTFISAAFQCWRRWFWAYVMNIFPAQPADALLFGSAYHALMEGVTPDEVMKLYPKHVEGALAAYKDRLENGPKLPVAEVHEEQVDLFDGLMTSKPDRVEEAGGKPIARDYKSTFQFSEHDDAKWNVDGGIIGEILAVEGERALVDIQRKSGEGKNTKLVTVTLTPAKQYALERMVMDFWVEVSQRLQWAADRTASNPFPRNLVGCVGKYGPCPYYEKCWGKPPESLLYVKSETKPRWVRGDKKLMKLVEAARAGFGLAISKNGEL